VAARKSPSKELPDAVRDAVERTVQATVGSAERSRSRAQGALDDIAGNIAGRVKGGMPATNEDIRDIKAELRRIGRRLDAIEERLPARRKKRST
jgi:hypothetical protein